MTIPTEALALVPSFPTKKESARLYSMVIIMLRTVGTASRGISLGMGVPTSLSYCACSAADRLRGSLTAIAVPPFCDL